MVILTMDGQASLASNKKDQNPSDQDLEFLEFLFTPLNTCISIFAHQSRKNNHNWCYDTKNPMPIGEWFNITLKQQQNDKGEYIYSISIDGVELRSIVNKTPMTF